MLPLFRNLWFCQYTATSIGNRLLSEMCFGELFERATARRPALLPLALPLPLHLHPLLPTPGASDYPSPYTVGAGPGGGSRFVGAWLSCVLCAPSRTGCLRA